VEVLVRQGVGAHTRCRRQVLWHVMLQRTTAGMVAMHGCALELKQL
jgi:hypothetical protein